MGGGQGMTDDSRAKLQELRHAIDDVDDRILDVLVERFEITRQVGIVKRDAGFDPVDRTREQELYDRIRLKAEERGIDPDVVESLYRTLIGHVVIEHEAIARGEEGTLGPGLRRRNP